MPRHMLASNVCSNMKSEKDSFWVTKVLFWQFFPCHSSFSLNQTHSLSAGYLPVQYGKKGSLVCTLYTFYNFLLFVIAAMLAAPVASFHYYKKVLINSQRGIILSAVNRSRPYLDVSNSNAEKWPPGKEEESTWHLCVAGCWVWREGNGVSKISRTHSWGSLMWCLSYLIICLDIFSKNLTK